MIGQALGIVLALVLAAVSFATPRWLWRSVRRGAGPEDVLATVVLSCAAVGVGLFLLSLSLDGVAYLVR